MSVWKNIPRERRTVQIWNASASFSWFKTVAWRCEHIPACFGLRCFLKIQYWAYLVFLNAPPQSSTVCATNAISTSKCGQTPTVSMIRASSMLRSQRIGKGQKHTHTTQNTEADTGHFKGFCGSFFLCELPSTTSLPQSDIFSDALWWVDSELELEDVGQNTRLQGLGGEWVAFQLVVKSWGSAPPFVLGLRSYWRCGTL